MNSGYIHTINALIILVYLINCMCYCPTPTLHLNLALTGDGAFLLSPQKTHTVWFISILNYGDTENVLINHLLLVIPMSYPCHYTNLCPHKPHKHAHTHTHTHTHTHIYIIIIISLYNDGIMTHNCIMMVEDFTWPLYIKNKKVWIKRNSPIMIQFVTGGGLQVKGFIWYHNHRWMD